MLITIKDLQDFTGIYPEDETSQQQLFIGAANDIVKNYLRYNPETQSYKKYINGADSRFIYFPVRFIKHIESISIDGKEIPLNQIDFDDNEIFFKDSKQTFPKGFKNILVELNAGLDEIPEIIKITALRIAAILQTEAGNNIGITSKSFQGEGTRTFVNTTNFDKYLIQISDYRLK